MEKNLDMLILAKSHLEHLANGRDPASGVCLPGDTLLNSVELSRCFWFAAGVLDKVIENGGEVKRASKHKLPPFTISADEKAGVELTDEPVQITRFCQRINSQVDTEKQSKLKVIAFGKWLLEKEILTIDVYKGKEYRRPTELGESIGLSSSLRTYGDREYYATTYSKEAQQFLIDNLDEVIAISNGAEAAQ